MRDSDLAVEVSVEGEQRALPPTVDVSAYRIVQEALTNTLKHSAASRADVHLRYWPDELEVEIVDDGRPNGGPSSATGRARADRHARARRAARRPAQRRARRRAAGSPSGSGCPTPDGAL